MAREDIKRTPLADDDICEAVEARDLELGREGGPEAHLGIHPCLVVVAQHHGIERRNDGNADEEQQRRLFMSLKVCQHLLPLWK